MHERRGLPGPVALLAGETEVELVWRNQLDGLTFHVGQWFVKWNPHGTGVDLARERRHLVWLRGRHPVPVVVEFGEDDEGQWLVTDALPGDSAVAERWVARPDVAVAAIAAGLRALHDVDHRAFPPEWSNESWATRAPTGLGPRPTVSDPVLVHGDACAPNTLLSTDGWLVGNVDFVDLAVADRWADLAVASMSLEWNYGPGHEPRFFASYGVEPDPVRIDYYRRLWHLES